MSRVAAQIGFLPNSMCNPQYVYDKHKPPKLEEYLTDEEWDEFIESIEKTLGPAKKFQRSIYTLGAIFLGLYITIIVSTLTILKEVNPSVIQLSIMIAINALFIWSLFRAEKGVRDLAKRRLRKAIAKASEKHPKLSFSFKQQARAKGKMYTYIEILILEPIAALGGWDEASDGEVVLNLEDNVESA